MGTKENLLKLFEENRGVYFSGEEIAEQLSISRTAVWKAVNSLRKEGYHISAVKNTGYALSRDTDILSREAIQKYLEPICDFVDVRVFGCVSSTNTLLREDAIAGEAEGDTIIAHAQSQGRGRLGRSFFSPEDTGVYLSVLLRPKACSAEQAVRFTTMAAVAACEAIEALSEDPAEIKWVNDIYMHGKKVSGILTEASFGMETGELEYIILGIGFNVYEPKEAFPDELKSIAGAIFKERGIDLKNKLAAGFLNRFMHYYKEGEDHVAKYQERSFVIGKDIMVITPRSQKKARAIDVDRECRLIVEYEDGTRDALSSGEISIRPVQED